MLFRSTPHPYPARLPIKSYMSRATCSRAHSISGQTLGYSLTTTKFAFTHRKTENETTWTFCLTDLPKWLNSRSCDYLQVELIVFYWEESPVARSLARISAYAFIAWRKQASYIAHHRAA